MNNLFREDLDQYQLILDNYEALSSNDGVTAYELAKKSLILADRWSDIALSSSQLYKEVGIAKTDFYNFAYQKYRILTIVHEHCRVVYRQCAEAERNKWNE